MGSFLGCIWESVWCVIKNRRFESRKGLIYGLLIPVYGIASLLLTLIVEWLNITNPSLLFVTSFVLCGAVEYLCSYFQEKVFKTKSWDYSNMKFNLNGRVNLVYALFFAILGSIWCNVCLVKIDWFVDMIFINEKLKHISILMIILVGYSIIISALACGRQRSRKQGIAPENDLEVWLDKKYNDEFLEKVYANSRDV